MASLRITIKGRKVPHPAFLASGPPANNFRTMELALQAPPGWNIVTKTFCINPEAAHVVNASQRIARWYFANRELAAMQNIELISTTPASIWYDYIKRIKDKFPDCYLIASGLAGMSADEWAELVGKSREAGADGFEGNVSCPHGLPDFGMGSAIGEAIEALRLVCSYIKAATPADMLCLVKVTPNVANIRALVRAALQGGIDGISAINTVSGLMINYETLKPKPLVKGVGDEEGGTYGGISGPVVRDVAQGVIAKISSVVRDEYDGGRLVSAIGGIWDEHHAAAALGCGGDFFQMCTRPMQDGYDFLQRLLDHLAAKMDKLGFDAIQPTEGIDPRRVLQGYTLRYIYDRQADLVLLDQERRAVSGTFTAPEKLLDEQWTGDIVADTNFIGGGDDRPA